jgi:hypothetical protein
MPRDLSVLYVQPEHELIDYDKEAGGGFYMPKLAPFLPVTTPFDVKESVQRRIGKDHHGIVRLIETG